MRASQAPFIPTPNATKSITAGVASANVQIQLDNNDNNVVRLFNSGANTVFVEFGGSTVTASVTTSMPVAAGQFFIVGNTQQYVAAITAAATSVLYITPGNGVS